MRVCARLWLVSPGAHHCLGYKATMLYLFQVRLFLALEIFVLESCLVNMALTFVPGAWATDWQQWRPFCQGPPLDADHTMQMGFVYIYFYPHSCPCFIQETSKCWHL